MPIETRCSKIIHGFGMFSSVQCSHAMKVMHNDKPYCNKHDPEKVKARRAERDAKWQAKYDEQKRVLADTISLAAALGAGEPEYSTLSGKGRYTGSIVLTADEAQQLIERLTKVKR